MIPDDKMREIARSLLEKSRANQVEWRMWRDGTTSVPNGVVDVQFQRSKVRLRHFSPRTEPDYYVMELCNEKGTVVAKLRAEGGEGVTEEGLEDWTILDQLYSEAVRYATGWDQVLADIEKEIGKEGKIGSAPKVKEDTPDPPPAKTSVAFGTDRARHVFDRDCIAFPATVDGNPVMCLVSAELLMQRFGAKDHNKNELLAAFRRGSNHIQEAALRLIEAGSVTSNGEVSLTTTSYLSQ